jgi:hypothetical protein
VRAGDRLQPAGDDGPLTPAVAETLRALGQKPEDAALVQLVRHYAATIDQAAEIAEDAALIEVEDEDQAKRLAALQRRVERQAVLAELGPKLHAALAELGASPKSRAGMLGKGGAPLDSDAAKSKLEQLRDRRLRPNRAAVVDAPAS